MSDREGLKSQREAISVSPQCMLHGVHEIIVCRGMTTRMHEIAVCRERERSRVTSWGDAKRI